MLCVMAKVPIPGATKTRLAPTLGAERAAAFSAAMAADVCAIAAASGLPWRVCIEGPEDHPWITTLPCSTERQCPGDLGDRLSHALRQGGVAIGTDCVLLSPDTLVAAHDQLRVGADLVLGLAPDGGYTFVAASVHAVRSGIFAGIPWSSPHTAAAQLRRAQELGLSITTMDGTFDVDEPEDIEALRRALAQMSNTVAPHSRAWLAL
jgi:rSAM/selenodomain-associated transferase 1